MERKLKFEEMSGAEVVEYASYGGIAVKTFFGALIAFITYGMFFMMLQNGSITYNPIVAIVLMFAQIGLFIAIRSVSLKSANSNSIMLPILFYIFAITEGFVMAVITGALTYYFQDQIGNFVPIVILAVALTILVLMVSIIVVSKLEVNERVMGIARRIQGAFVIFFVTYFIFFMIALVLNLFGVSGPWELVFNLNYGTGLIGIGFSAIIVLWAAFSLIADVYYGKVAVAMKASKNFEYAVATSILVGIVFLYVEILKLLVKLFASRD